MSLRQKLTGTGVALVTPFKSNSDVDLDALSRVIDFVIKGGAEYVVTLGTTGETPTLSKEEKIAIVRKTIAESIILLNNALKLLSCDDPEIVKRFDKWFGCFNEERKLVIVERIKKQIVFFEELGMNYFSRIAYEIDYRRLFAMVYPWDTQTTTIFLGHTFWNDRLFKSDPRPIAG